MSISPSRTLREELERASTPPPVSTTRRSIFITKPSDNTDNTEGQGQEQGQGQDANRIQSPKSDNDSQGFENGQSQGMRNRKSQAETMAQAQAQYQYQTKANNSKMGGEYQQPLNDIVIKDESTRTATTRSSSSSSSSTHAPLPSTYSQSQSSTSAIAQTHSNKMQSIGMIHTSIQEQVPNSPPPQQPQSDQHQHYSTNTFAGKLLTILSHKFIPEKSHRSGATFAGFLSLLVLTMSNYMLGPMRDAAALKVGVTHIPILTLASTILALASSVPMGWLFEAPDPRRRGRIWGRVGLTRGETQGTSLALFLRCFAICLIGYAFSFKLMDLLANAWSSSGDDDDEDAAASEEIDNTELFRLEGESFSTYLSRAGSLVLGKFGKVFYVAFFLVVHLMKLHSISLMWGVTSEAMEYEEQAELRALRKMGKQDDGIASGNGKSSKQTGARLKKLAFVGFGGTLGGIIGSVIVSLFAQTLQISGLLIVASSLLLLSAEFSVEMGQIMFRHWEEEQLELCSNDDLTSLILSQNTGDTDVCNQSISSSKDSSGSLNSRSRDNLDEFKLVDTSIKRVPSIGGMKKVASAMSMNSTSSEVDSCMKKVASVGSMKRCASGNSLNNVNIRRALSSGNNLNALGKKGSSSEADINPDTVHMTVAQSSNGPTASATIEVPVEDNDNSFKQRLLRGITTILRSRLLMTIFTYNALYATTTVLLSFQRAELVANRSSSNSVETDTAFLANINIASSVAVFALQASGIGAYIANSFGQRGTLSLMPVVRLIGVALLGFWHVKGGGRPPNLLAFLILDEFTKVVNFAVAKPVRENLWRGLSNEARYEAKPIVDTLANRWGGGTAAFLVSALDRIMTYSGYGEKLEDGTKSLFGFPPLLILCSISVVWWSVVSADLGHIRQRIDLELKKQE